MTRMRSVTVTEDGCVTMTGGCVTVMLMEDVTVTGFEDRITNVHEFQTFQNEDGMRV